MQWITALVSQIDVTHIITAQTVLICALILKSLLDFKLAPFLVHWFSWIPVRNIFRAKPIKLAGAWKENWSSESANFKASERQSYPIIYQMGSYCYAEFIAKKVTYSVFGVIKGNYLCGDWYDKKDPHGYFGTFQLQIIDSFTMEGIWIGHSTRRAVVQADGWVWKKITEEI